MFGRISVGTRSIDEYRAVVGNTVVDELRRLAEPLQRARILHLSSPAAPGVVRNILQSAIPLMANLGLQVQWQQLRMPREFAEMDRDLRSALSGEPLEWTSRQTAQWTAFNMLNAQLFDEDFDVVGIHHTASVGLFEAVSHVRGAKPPGVWIWHSHRDYRDATPEAWGLIRQHASNFHAGVYPFKAFLRPDAPNRVNVAIPPGVDAVGARAQPVANEIRDALLSQRGIDVHRPILSQIISSTRPESPLAVLESFQMVKAYRPEVQMVVANLAFTEGAELRRTIDLVTSRAEKIGDILHLTELDKVGNVEISSLRQESTVMIHQGMPHGISMELLEEMWQSRPIVSGRSPMALATLTDGRHAILADSPIDQAEAIIALLDAPKVAARLGRTAHAAVANHYLITHHLAGYLKLLQRLLGRRPSRSKS